MNGIPDLNRSSSPIARISGWLFSSRILRCLLIGLIGFITLVALVYAEENWRGTRACEQYKRKMAAIGEVLDWSTLFPAAIPDEQNIFKAPKMSEWFLDRRSLAQAPLDHPVTNDFARQFINQQSNIEITNADRAGSYLVWSDQFQDDFDII